MRPILTLTINPTIDLTMEIDALEPTGKNRATLLGVAPGGGGINVARALVELGGEATAIHTSGGAVGARLERLFDEEGLPHEAVDIEGETREALVLFEREHHRSYHIVPPGPEMSPAARERLTATLSHQLREGAIVVASGSVPPGIGDDVYAAMADLVRGSGAKLVLDTSGAALRPALESGVYVVKPNRREAGTLVGHEIEDLDDALEAGRRLFGQGAAEIVIVTAGELGAAIVHDGSEALLHTPPLPRKARSDRGAGDSFVAGLTLGLARGDDPVDACATAVAAGAAAVLTPGTELCRREDVESLRPKVGITRSP
ncbi:MAG: 1-phosphofructokinase family hexose kinase [Candidatus Limnocylindrales bacterium]